MAKEFLGGGKCTSLKIGKIGRTVSYMCVCAEVPCVSVLAEVQRNGGSSDIQQRCQPLNNFRNETSRIFGSEDEKKKRKKKGRYILKYKNKHRSVQF